MIDSVRAARQRGLSMLGFLFVAAVLVVVAMVGFRVVPSYIEYYSVKKALDDTLREGTDNQQAMRSSLTRRLQTSYVEMVSGKDMVVTKTGNQITASLAWEQRLHMVGNAYILLEFEASATR